MSIPEEWSWTVPVEYANTRYAIGIDPYRLERSSDATFATGVTINFNVLNNVVATTTVSSEQLLAAYYNTGITYHNAVSGLQGEIQKAKLNTAKSIQCHNCGIDYEHKHFNKCPDCGEDTETNLGLISNL